jgi:hypothetical protein
MASKRTTAKTEKTDSSAARIATIAAGAAIGSAAIAAAVIFTGRKRDGGTIVPASAAAETPASDRTPPETD